jgi:hypothetical protein
MNIISFDPGGSTGVAHYNMTKDEWYTWTLGPNEHRVRLWEDLETYHFGHIVYETFLYQRRSVDKGVSLELISKEYIGIINLYAALYEVPVHGQSPPQRMFWTDAKLKQLSLWGSTAHERDAVRHLLYFITFTLKDDRFLQQLK